MRDRRLLVVAVALALVFAVVWVWRAAGDEATSRSPVAAGQTGRLGAASYRLASLQALERTTGRYDQLLVPEPGAVLVVARIEYNATGIKTFFPCTFELVAGESTWRSEFGYIPPQPADSSCRQNTTGTVAVVFEVPVGALDQVEGVAVVNPGGTTPLLLGRPA